MANIANLNTQIFPKIFVPDQFSAKFMSKKADKMRKIFILHPKARNGGAPRAPSARARGAPLLRRLERVFCWAASNLHTP